MGRLEVPPLLEELGRHVVEDHRELADLAESAGSDAVVEIPARIAAAPAESSRTGRAMARAPRAAATPTTRRAMTVRPPSPSRVRVICASIRRLDRPTRTVPQRSAPTRTGTAKS